MPAAWGKLVVGCGVDWLDCPAGGFCVVVNGAWASAEPAESIIAATNNLFMRV